MGSTIQQTGRRAQHIENASAVPLGSLVVHVRSTETRCLHEIGLVALDEYSRGKHGAVFTALSADKQDDLLRDVESGKATGFVPDARTFFATLREHAIQGMFSDPCTA